MNRLASWQQTVGVLASLAVAGLVESTALGAAADLHARLIFDTNAFTVRSLKVSAQTVEYRAYEGIVYVSSPVDTNYQCLNIYVPAPYYEGKSIGPYNAATAPILLPITVGGYMPGRPGTPGAASGPGGGGPPGGPGRSERPDAIAAALARGMVVAAPGARGRTLKDASGRYTGKAPACIVDLKAAVRYLRHNDGIMPGDARRIISNGTSAGGALSALLGATGNSPDYLPDLRAIGAAEEPDGVFGASCYCPITDLDHADAAYEWFFSGVTGYQGFRGSGTLTAEQVALSDALTGLFPAYVNGLGLKRADGVALTLDARGEGSFKEYVKSFLIASAQAALNSGQELAGVRCLSLRDRKVTDVNLGEFAAFATRMKTPPAFDALDLRSPENSLFGTVQIDAQHFTPFARERSADHSMAEEAIIRMMNPLNYIGADGVATASHWRIRHGAVDRDTSLAIPVLLTTRLRNGGSDVDFAVPWGQGHGGDYDLEQLFAWIARICP